MQNCQLPSFFLTSTAGDVQELRLGYIAPFCSMSAICMSTVSLRDTGKQHIDCLIGGVSDVLIGCLTILARPSGLTGLAKTSEYILNSFLKACLLKL